MKVNKNRCLIAVDVINEVEALQVEQEIRIYDKKYHKQLTKKYFMSASWGLIDTKIINPGDFNLNNGKYNKY